MGHGTLYSDTEFIDALVALGAVDRNDADRAGKRIEREANATEVAAEVGCSRSAARTRLEQLADEKRIEHRAVAASSSVWWIER
jgi:hypothetical protein